MLLNKYISFAVAIAFYARAAIQPDSPRARLVVNLEAIHGGLQAILNLPPSLFTRARR